MYQPTEPDFEQPEEDLVVGVEAPPPVLAKGQWSWTPGLMLGVAGGVLALTCAVYFLMAYSAAKAAAVKGGDSDE